MEEGHAFISSSSILPLPSAHTTHTPSFRSLVSSSQPFSSLHISSFPSYMSNHPSLPSTAGKRIRNMWKHQPAVVKSFLCVLAGVFSFLLLRFFLLAPNGLFVASESAHALGIAALLYKLRSTRNCTGLSLKSQQLTAIFLAVRLYCSLAMERNIHTILDAATLLATCWAICTIRVELKHADRSSDARDNLPMHYLVIPCAVLACVIHPRATYSIANSVLWAFSVYMEAVSVLPQLRVMRNLKYVEPFTAHYVFALGVARSLAFTHWVCEVIETRGGVVTTMGTGVAWAIMVILAEIVQTSILADFCYHYVQSTVDGQLIKSMTAADYKQKRLY